MYWNPGNCIKIGAGRQFYVKTKSLFDVLFKGDVTATQTWKVALFYETLKANVVGHSEKD